MSLCRARLRSVVVVATLLVALAIVRAGAAHAAVFHAGPDAAPPATIQEAIDAAVAAGGGDHEVRVQGVVFEGVAGLVVPPLFAAGTLRITGGWDASFATRSAATPTVLAGDGSNRILALLPSGGTLILEDLTITDGVMANGNGGGMLVEALGDSRVELHRVTIEGNQAENGGGLYAYLQDDAVFVIEDGRVSGNLASNLDDTASGGGIHLRAFDAARFTIRRLEIRDNTALSVENQASAGGIFARWCDGASGAITDNLIQDNETSSWIQLGSNGALWQGSSCSVQSSGEVEIRRNRWLGGIGDTSEQLNVISNGTGTVWLTDSLVAGGAGSGLTLSVRGESTLHATHLTIADQVSHGVFGSCDPGATLTFANTIVFGNGTDAAPACAQAVSNLIGVDPGFAGPDDYTPGAPAIDQGAAHPPGGLGPSDLDGRPRTIGLAPDLGAIEAPEPAAAAGAAAALAALAARAARSARRRRR